MSVKKNIKSEQPLSKKVIEYLISYKNEDKYVDYKESIDQEKDWRNEKHWLGLTKDFMAFANTEGGYLIFGVEDSDFEVVGLSESLVDTLSETKNILDKINRYVRPEFTDIKSSKYEHKNGVIVAVFIPPSHGKTHIVTKEGSFRYPDGGEKKMVLRPGDIYVRRSATNNVISPEELEDIINRRIDYYKDKLFKRISRISEADPKKLIKSEEEIENADGYYPSAKPDAEPAKGMSFTKKPSTIEQEIAAYISISKKDPNHEASEKRLWEMYRRRENIKLVDEYSIWLFRSCVKKKIPSLYWCKNIDKKTIKSLIREVAGECETIGSRSYISRISTLLGDSFYKGTINKFNKGQRKQMNIIKSVENYDIDETFNAYLVDGYDKISERSISNEFIKKCKNEIEEIEVTSKGELGTMDKRRAIALDYVLYSDFV